MQYRQGDVFLESVEEIPSDAIPIEGEIILAHGEATGHAHRVSGWAKLYEKAGERFLSVQSKSTVLHEEHASITLPKGNYRVLRQREYTPERIINVAD